MRVCINIEIAQKYGMPAALTWAALEKVINADQYVQIKVSEICKLSGKLFSETPIKKAIKEFERDELIYRICNANAEGARFKLGPNGVHFYRMPRQLREQTQSQAHSSQLAQGVASTSL